MRVFVQLLRLHFDTQRWVLLILSIGAFSVPLGLLKLLGSPVFASDLGKLDEAILFIPAAAVAIGLMTGIGAWEWDFEGDHIYAMSLPATRWEYALLKMAAGGVLVLLPTLMFWAGSLLATGNVELGDSVLQTYATEVASRFLFVALLSFALAFAVMSGTKQMAGTILIGGFLVIFVGEGANGLLTLFVPGWPIDSVMEALVTRMNTWPGPLSVFTGNWMLIDF